MQPRTIRFIKIWATVILGFILAAFALMGCALILRSMPEIYVTYGIIGLLIGLILVASYKIAEEHLEYKERDEARILKSLSKGNDE